MKSFSTRTFSGLGLAFALAIVLASGCHSGDGVENALGEGGDGGGDTEEALNGVLKIEQERYSFLEGAGIVTIEVLRAGGAQGAVSVSYAAAGDSAAAFADFIVREGERLVWEDGDAEPKEISILIQGNDDDGTPSETEAAPSRRLPARLAPIRKGPKKAWRLAPTL